MTTRGNASLTVRAEPQVHERVQRAADRAGVTRAAWLHEAILAMLEMDEEAAAGHVPDAIRAATPQRRNGRIIFPTGRVFDHR